MVSEGSGAGLMVPAAQWRAHADQLVLGRGRDESQAEPGWTLPPTPPGSGVGSVCQRLSRRPQEHWPGRAGGWGALSPLRFLVRERALGDPSEGGLRLPPGLRLLLALRRGGGGEGRRPWQERLPEPGQKADVPRAMWALIGACTPRAGLGGNAPLRLPAAWPPGRGGPGWRAREGGRHLLPEGCGVQATWPVAGWAVSPVHR